MKNIKNVVFDLGGVICDLEMDRVVEAFREIGMPKMAALMDPCYPAEVNERMESGQISWEEACDEMRRLDNRPDITNDQIKWVYEEFLARIDEEKLRTIEALRERGLRTYILSNTNPVAIEIVREHFRRHGREMNELFDGIYLSFELGILKPKPAIFEEVIRRSGIVPEETLFIDDGARNADAAHALGFQVFCPETNGEFKQLFE
ncbi:MAG: HAD family phosphatase [Alistipes sp.]|nr:HAD family phosphatase [Alistipes sp.]